MFELPEARVIAEQISTTLKGKTISKVVANAAPHKFAWFYGDPSEYDGNLSGLTMGNAYPWGGLVEIECGPMRLLFGDGVNLRYAKDSSECPAKHQLLVAFTDGSFLAGSVQMYGGLWAFKDGENQNPYYLVAKKKPSPLCGKFDGEYFDALVESADPKLSLKAFLATDQRIPGLGNGVLQDILFTARLHPKRKLADLPAKRKDGLYDALKRILSQMAARGGRDTERNLFGEPGGYATLMCRNTLEKPCPACGGKIEKLAYMGGSVYVCPVCQE